MKDEGKKRGDLVGNEGTIALTVSVIDAKEFPPMVFSETPRYFGQYLLDGS